MLIPSNTWALTYHLIIDGGNVCKEGWIHDEGNTTNLKVIAGTLTRNWKIWNILFDAYVVQTVLYRVDL